MHMPLDILQRHIDHFQAEGYSFCVSQNSWNRGRVSVSLEKSSDDISIKVSGQGASFIEAIEEALAKFPQRPGDNRPWDTRALPAPTIDDEDF
jgi:hypothetical protein